MVTTRDQLQERIDAITALLDQQHGSHDGGTDHTALLAEFDHLREQLKQADLQAWVARISSVRLPVELGPGPVKMYSGSGKLDPEVRIVFPDDEGSPAPDSSPVRIYR